mmetsp:Transcript_7411/g.18056  ORF Transcript_7411/g.18056 Transcript_7411/m.18056 type:complete len:947 (+) Transcript_7411:159-2999(+)|eukprot:CAMPEP_0114494436 /NCGR_PEP_ID=MMETSP0109-20121206/4651_1 /TAXON_ID=29199 /ORGANISM="Chlorarachnion reptans, Strain CCCM449" /LENGTH=946 /DNA_ID=CAMNT_0001671473 /DNA_START=99 /DNA_END=2939 /DNA_ORIENTATION=+
MESTGSINLQSQDFAGAANRPTRRAPNFFGRQRRAPQIGQNENKPGHQRAETFIGSQCLDESIQARIRANERKNKELTLRKRSPLKAIAIDEGSTPNSKNASWRTQPEGVVVDIVDQKDEDYGKTWNQNQYTHFVHSDHYEVSEKKIKNKAEDFRLSNAMNDDDFDVAIVFVLGMPSTVRPRNDEAEKGFTEESPKPTGVRVRKANDENAGPSNIVEATKKKSKAIRNKRSMLKKISAALDGIPKEVSEQLRELVRRIISAGLTLKVDSHSIDGRILLKVAAPLKRLYAEAEAMGLRMRLKNGTYQPFENRYKEYYQGNSTHTNVLFRSSQRQQIILHILKSSRKYGRGVDINEFGQQVVKIFPLHMYMRTQTMKHNWLRAKCDTWSILSLANIPINKIQEYHGEEGAFYFAFMRFLTSWLIFPSFVGVIVYAVQGGSTTLNHPIIPFYCIVLVFWAALLILFWRRESACRAHRWGVLGYEQTTETVRPDFHGESRENPVTGERERYFPMHRRAMSILSSLLVQLICTGMSITLLFVAFWQRDEHLKETEQDEEFTFGSLFKSDVALELFFVPFVVSFIIPIADFLYKFPARALTDRENWKYESTHNTSFVLKVFTFRCLNTYVYMYYIAFGDKSTTTAKLSAQIFSFIVSGICLRWWGRFGWPKLLYSLHNWRIDTGYSRAMKGLKKVNQGCMCCKSWGRESGEQEDTFPEPDWPVAPRVNKTEVKNNDEVEKGFKNACNSFYLGLKIKLGFLSKQFEPVEIRKLGMNKKSRDVSQAWRESYQPLVNYFEDYYSMMIMIGYVIFFSASFPLAPLMVCASNWVELRLFSPFKMCVHTQRPIPIKVGGIGIWFKVLQIMSVIAILTNVAIIGARSEQVQNWFPNLSAGETVFVLFVFEHFLLALYYIATLVITETPKSLQRELMREGRLKLEDDMTGGKQSEHPSVA